LHEKKSDKIPNNLIDGLFTDERIALQSEEIWESLTIDEQEELLKFVKSKNILTLDKEKVSYVWSTGIIGEKGIFSELFEKYISQKSEISKGNIKHELSKKEHQLLKILVENRGALSEREKIIEFVWPEAESYGVSDWAVDRLVARLRGKLKSTNSEYEIITVKTRGYKLA